MIRKPILPLFSRRSGSSSAVDPNAGADPRDGAEDAIRALAAAAAPPEDALRALYADEPGA